jgi:23S rRNA (cytosine1962-C5)-methyltransferase
VSAVIDRELKSLLRAAYEKRAQLGLPSADTDAYRLVHGAADGLPWLTVDVYAQFVVVSLLADCGESELLELFRGLLSLGFAGVYLKRRPRQANVLSDEDRKARTPERAVFGASAPTELVVRESARRFLVRLGDGLSTGLFLDQRDNRARVHALANATCVLNLFSYTCAFGSVAAQGGATTTTNIDVSKAALERGKQNYAQAGIDPGRHRFLARDVLEELPKLKRRGERYDLVVLDPPSYASTKHGRFSVDKDFAHLVSQCLALVSETGRLLACTNQQSLSSPNFERMLRAGSAQAGGRYQIALVPPPADFPSPPGGNAHLKSAWFSPV